MDSFYEIICDIGVIGVISDRHEGEALLYACEQDKVLAFGRITEEEFNSYGDDPWERPRSSIRWKPVITKVIQMQRILQVSPL